MVTLHDLALSTHLADRTIVLNHKGIVTDGPSASVLCPQIMESQFVVHYTQGFPAARIGAY